MLQHLSSSKCVFLWKDLVIDYIVEIVVFVLASSSKFLWRRTVLYCPRGSFVHYVKSTFQKIRRSIGIFENFSWTKDWPDCLFRWLPTGGAPSDRIVEEKSKQLSTLLDALRSAKGERTVNNDHGEWKVIFCVWFVIYYFIICCKRGDGVSNNICLDVIHLSL